jgi:tetratricopeptide (TPR) repeat protein
MEASRAAVTQSPGFDWQKLTNHLAEATHAHDEARDFYQRSGENWQELLPLARDIWALVREGPDKHAETLRRFAELNLLLNDQVLPILGELRRKERDPLSAVEIIVEFIRTQRASDIEARQKFQQFVDRRDRIDGQGGHHYHQPDDWKPGHRTRKPWREAGLVFVPRAPLLGDDDVPPPGTNYYLHGESGHGKSILAANIAQRLIDKGYRALTFNLRKPGDILNHLALLTDKEWLGLEAPKDNGQGWPDDTAKIIAVCTWLLEEAGADDKKHPPYCLVWDNADDLVTLDHLFQLQLLHHRGVQIITTRIPATAFEFPEDHPCHNWPPRKLTIQHVGPYTEKEALAHLYQVMNDPTLQPPKALTADQRKRILKAARLAPSGGQVDPLQLHDLITTLSKHSWRFDEVLGKRTATPRPSVPVVAEQSHTEVLGRMLEGLSPLTKAVWRVLVHLAPVVIPEAFWQSMERIFREPEDLPEEEREAIAVELRGRLPIIQVRAALANAGLLTGGDDGDVVHARHHAIGRELTPPTDRPVVYRMVVKLIYEAAPSGNPHNDPKTWPFYKSADAHLLAALALERVPAILKLAETGWLPNRFTPYLIHHSRLVEAAAFAQLVLENSLATSGENSPAHAASLHELARVHLNQGRHAEAEAGFQRALEIFRAHHGDSHPSTATTLHELARTHLNQGRHAEAEAGFWRALEIYHAHHGDSHLSIATTLQVMASVHLEQGRHAEAETGFQRALEIYRAHHGDSHPSIAATLYGLAGVHLAQGRHAEAEAGFQSSLKIDRAHHGENSWEAALSKSGLARVLWGQENIGQAIELFTRAQEELEAALDANHIRVGRLLQQWAACELGEIPGDSPLHNETAGRIHKSLEILRKSLKEDHPEIAQSRLLLAECLRRSGDLAAARTEAEAAAAVLEKALPLHKTTTQARALLAALS